ncbi:hypothetical protein A2U01_0055368, partial [Trifolium medium]|nr:hypothetical protein [Trifolium medium]
MEPEEIEEPQELLASSLEDKSVVSGEGNDRTSVGPNHNERP